MVAGMLCIINGKTFHSFTKNTLSGNLGASCHITNNDTGLHYNTNIKESVQRSLGNTSTIEKGKLHIRVHQVYGSKRLHILWPVKYCAKAGVNQYIPTCKLLQENKIISNCKNNRDTVCRGQGL